MKNWKDDDIENKMVLLKDREECSDEEDYLAEESDRRWKEMQEERYDGGRN